jgi:glycosyltransferase involved in cell wall biosynthesis
MNVLGLSSMDSGCGYHRVLLPLGFMEDIYGYVTNVPTVDVLEKNWDIILFNRFSPFDAHLNRVKEDLNCKIVLDLDDAWELPANHISYNAYKHLQERLETNIRNADMVTTTNERLAEKIRPLNSNVKIFKNSIPFGMHQFTADKSHSDKVRIFWAGSITHEEDIAILKNPVKRLMDQKNRIEMVLGGYNDINSASKIAWDRIVSHFTNARKLPYQLLHGTIPTKYMQMYEDADIMLIPLQQSDWHSCKSNLKLLEAASKKIPCIVSKVEPYYNGEQDNDMPVLWVNYQSDWYKLMNYLINNKSAREDYGEKLYEWAKERYDIRDTNVGRREAFADLIKS